VTKPVHPEGTVGEILFDRPTLRYIDERTRKQLDWSDINARIAPNTWTGGTFYDPSGKEITLAQAQERELVTA
jgi:hypothetical protein